MSPEKRRQLITFLQATGVLEARDAARMLAEPTHVNGNVLQDLVSSGMVSFEALQEALLRVSTPANVPPADTSDPVPSVAAPEVPEHLFNERHISDQQLQEFLLDHGRLPREQLDVALRDQQHTGHPLWRSLINLQLLSPQDMMDVLRTLGTAAPESEVLEGTPPKRREREWHGLRMTSRMTAVELVNAIFEGAAHARATDIHLEPNVPQMRIRYRIDGVLFDVMAIPADLEMPVISRIKVLADMDITERRLPQDGHIAIRVVSQEYNMRVATIPTTNGEKLVLRLLNTHNVLTGLKQLGLDTDDEQRVRRLIAKPQGMILVTGPIGSGKTTSLYAALNEVDILANNIVTIEDPVEYQLPGVTQVEVDVKGGLTFASGLRAMLRQDADILMVGEIRDHETAAVAVRAALTGQQLFSTLHTVGAPSAITTLENFGIQPYLVASALNGVVAQRLVRCVCPMCRRWYTPSKAVLQQVGLPHDRQDYRFAYGVGCETCYYTGYMGRTGLFEVLRVSDTIKHMIIGRADESALQAMAIQEGMHTLAQSGIKKILQGVTTPQEVMREVFL
jgi:type II secretory ATPase GspE/PulE/Tfp pilus assembly ATPase PilB-like protein